MPAQTASIQQLADASAYKELVADAIANDRNVCVKFYATWCRSCKAVAPKYRRIANKWPDVEFYEIGRVAPPSQSCFDLLPSGRTSAVAP